MDSNPDSVAAGQWVVRDSGKDAIGPKVNLTPGSISAAVDRLFDKGLVSRVESPEDRRVRVVSLTPKGKELITPAFRKHAAEIGKVFADASPKNCEVLKQY